MARRILQGIVERGEATEVPDNEESSVLTFTVPGGSIWVDRIDITGEWAGQFMLYLNGVHKETKRVEVGDQGPHFDFQGQMLRLGTVVAVKVIHYDSGQEHQFEATLKAHR